MFGLPKNSKRLFFFLSLLLLVLAVDLWYRRWHPNETMTTAHFQIQSTATHAQTQAVADLLEMLYRDYSAFASAFVDQPATNTMHQVKLYRDRRELHRCNRGLRWAEAFYRPPYAHAYYPSDEINPYHWMIHEVVHQLNQELSRLTLPTWINEGLAEYFACTQVRKGQFRLGDIDLNTYPVWWLDDCQFSGDLQNDITNTHIIPLSTIITGSGGPSLNQFFNLYYIHWWSLAHFLLHFEQGRYRTGFFQTIHQGGDLASFEKNIGPVDQIQIEWYGYLRHLQKIAQPSTPVPPPTPYPNW